MALTGVVDDVSFHHLDRVIDLVHESNVAVVRIVTERGFKSGDSIAICEQLGILGIWGRLPVGSVFVHALQASFVRTGESPKKIVDQGIPALPA